MCIQLAPLELSQGLEARKAGHGETTEIVGRLPIARDEKMKDKKEARMKKQQEREEAPRNGGSAKCVLLRRNPFTSNVVVSQLLEGVGRRNTETRPTSCLYRCFLDWSSTFSNPVLGSPFPCKGSWPRCLNQP